MHLMPIESFALDGDFKTSKDQDLVQNFRRAMPSLNARKRSLKPGEGSQD
jgi:hypothetical protein